MGEPAPNKDSSHVIATLREFIATIDRRVPQVQRAGEARIASDAAALRQEAVDRLEELTRT